jgi:hypothetical protein
VKTTSLQRNAASIVFGVMASATPSMSRDEFLALIDVALDNAPLDVIPEGSTCFMFSDPSTIVDVRFVAVAARGAMRAIVEEHGDIRDGVRAVMIASVDSIMAMVRSMMASGMPQEIETIATISAVESQARSKLDAAKPTS